MNTYKDLLQAYEQNKRYAELTDKEKKLFLLSQGGISEEVADILVNMINPGYRLSADTSLFDGTRQIIDDTAAAIITGAADKWTGETEVSFFVSLLYRSLLREAARNSIKREKGN